MIHNNTCTITCVLLYIEYTTDQPVHISTVNNTPNFIAIYGPLAYMDVLLFTAIRLFVREQIYCMPASP